MITITTLGRASIDRRMFWTGTIRVFWLFAALWPFHVSAQGGLEISETIRNKLEASSVFVRMSCRETVSSLDPQFDPALITTEVREAYASGAFITASGHVVTSHHALKKLKSPIVRDYRGIPYSAECPTNSIGVEFFSTSTAGLLRAIQGKDGDLGADIVSARNETQAFHDVLILQANLLGAHHPHLCVAKKLSFEAFKDLSVIGAGVRLDNQQPLFEVKAGKTTDQFGAREAARFLKMTLPSIEGLSGGPIVGTDGRLVGIYQGVTLAANPGHTTNHFSSVLSYYSALEAIGAICPERKPKVRLSANTDGSSTVLTIAVTNLPKGTEVGNLDLDILRPRLTQMQGQPAASIFRREVHCLVDPDRLAAGMIRRIRFSADVFAETQNDRFVIRSEFGLTEKGRSVQFLLRPILLNLFDEKIPIEPFKPFRLKISRDASDDPHLSRSGAKCRLLNG